MKVAFAPPSTLARLRLRSQREHRPETGRARLSAMIGGIVLLSSSVMPSSTETAIANGDTRTLSLYHSHTGESISATFRVNGSYDPVVLDRLNYFLRDWRNNDRTKMDPRLFDVVWEVYRTAGVTDPIVVYSAYRSPETNAMLRRRSSGVAEYSLHMRGMAMDTTLPGMSMERIREIGMRLQRGGVGYYSSSNFVHLDAGNVRSWPRMSYDQLARLFPDGKSVHLASNGRALPRYEEARAEIAARGGMAAPVVAERPGGFFAWLFGSRNEPNEEEENVAPARPAPARRGHVMTAAVDSGAATRNIAQDTRQDTRTEDGAGRNLSTSRQPNGTRTDDRVPVATPAPVAPSPAQIEPARLSPRTAGPVVASLAPAPAPIEQHPAAETGRSQQNAATEGEKREREHVADVPMPPARPQDREVLARVFADVPEPPTRPEKLVRASTLASAAQPDSFSKSPPSITSAGTTKPAESITRAADLPVVITRGPKDAPELPPRVLAYATAEETHGLPGPGPARPSVAPFAEGETVPASVAPARLDRSNYRRATSHVSISDGGATQSLLGPAFMGLRQAARISSDILSPVPSIGYVAVFGARASELESARFTGASTKPLEASPGLVRIMVSNLRPRAN